MGVSLGILFGILAMISWGAADFFVANAVKREKAIKVLLWSQITTLVISGLAYLLFFKLPEMSTSTIIMLALCGVLSVISWGAFYKGLQIGKVSIISPVANCWPVITIALSILFLGESLTTIQGLGVMLAIIGAVLVSFKFHDLLKLRNLAQGVPYAIVGFFGWGIMFYLLAILIPRIGWFFPMFFIKLFSVLYLVVYFKFAGKAVSFPGKIWLLVLLIGAFEMIASLSYSFGITLQYTAIIAPIIAGVPMVTVILARIFFKERVEWNQGIGIMAILAGLVLLAL
jgi:transporter family protein